MDGIRNRTGKMESPAGWIRQAALSRILASAGWGLLCLFASIVLTRRLWGTFSGGISPFGFAICLLIASLACCALKVIAEWPPHRLSRQTGLIFGTLVGLPLDVLAVTLLPYQWTYPGLILTLLWLTLVGWFCMSSHSCEFARRLIFKIVWPEVEKFLCPAGTQVASVPVVPAAPQVTPPDAPARESLISIARGPFQDETSTGEATEEFISRLQRRMLPDGGELLEGQLIATFEAGSKQAVLHVPFTPPFSAAPQVSCEIADGADARIKAAAVFRYGARLELKRNTSELPELDVAVEIYAELQSTEPPATVRIGSGLGTSV